MSRRKRIAIKNISWLTSGKKWILPGPVGIKPATRSPIRLSNQGQLTNIGTSSAYPFEHILILTHRHPFQFIQRLYEYSGYSKPLLVTWESLAKPTMFSIINVWVSVCMHVVWGVFNVFYHIYPKLLHRQAWDPAQIKNRRYSVKSCQIYHTIFDLITALCG